ncbi:MAG: DEAD/DEAH box helicase [candidate division KSB1 bacterium]|nr:DEAD/DEAH box helicase [candidate division KSB1 bacterium]MDZ7365910.1 DEAD/DEAH box helicase [candidate division KSB1 bacterium]MDZ7403856.1 DEAD/DEAH box helicase [candidate division KSB1 bacterium]
MRIESGEIQQLATPEIYERGAEYYRHGRVQLLRVDDKRVTARVRGQQEYNVVVHRNGSGFVTICNCPYEFTCKHIVATLLQTRAYYHQNGGDSSQKAPEKPQSKIVAPPADTEPKKPPADWRWLISTLPKAAGPETQRQSFGAYLSNRSTWGIYFTLQLGRHVWTMTPYRARRRKDGSYGAAYPTFLREQPYYRLNLSQKEKLALMLLDSLEQPNAYPYTYYPRNGYQVGYGQRHGMLLELLRDSEIYLAEDGQRQHPLRLRTEVARFEIRLQESADAVSLLPTLLLAGEHFPFDQDAHILTSEPIWILRGREIFKLENATLGSAGVEKQSTNDTAPPFIYFLQTLRQQHSLVIPKIEVNDFFASLTPASPLLSFLVLPNRDCLPALDRFTAKRLYLEEHIEVLKIRLKFLYGTQEVDCELPRDALAGQTERHELLVHSGEGLNFWRVVRDVENENQAQEQLIASGARQISTGEFVIRESAAIDWLLFELPKLQTQGFQVFGEDQLRRHKVRRAAPTLRVSVNSEIDWFDVQLAVDFGGIMLSLKELRKSLMHRTRYVKLRDGSTALLPADWLAQFSYLFNLGEAGEERLKVSRHHLTLIDALLDSAAEKEMDAAFQENLRRLRDFRGIQEIHVPENFHGELRPYQKQGLNWLYFLQEFRFGGCLADDMGLGKTIQALALLQNEKSRGVTTPSLIVSPTSVLFNWEKEIQRFTPNLQFLTHAGLERRRLKQFDDCDIVLTSYGVLRRDIAFLKEMKFHYVILDESQKIKNPLSQTAKAARLLQANHRLVLTGTPVENNTQELWSQFAFLNPGLLGSLNYFKGAFTRPIEKEQDDGAARQLRKIIFPFILRRTKDDVAKELPPKVESLYYCAMTEEQQKTYNRWRDYYRAHVMQQIDLKGLQKSRMYVLEGLTRLRQICCHPRLTEEKYHHDSGKFEALKEILENILAENHKVLIFSQFVRMLKIVCSHLDEQKIPFAYLDGHTSNRQLPVEQFQNDPAIKIFLISLRAGGFGLNLTAADYVILYDPWWNPAVEMQAIDRTHRIGQDKQVFAYKLITRDSVEEKILQLQERKKELVADLITTDSGMFKHLTREDIEGLFS